MLDIHYMSKESKNVAMSHSYKNSGVDIGAGNRLADRIKHLAKSTLRPEIISGVGGFSAISSIPADMKDPLLVSSTDGVGTKLKVAFEANKHDTIGIDLVAMVVNDIITSGAKPLFLLDYFSTSKLNTSVAEEVISGIVEGCRQANCALIGGETAEMPGMYAAGEYDLAGFGVGVVDRSKLIDGSRVQAGDVVIGLPSTGLHSNGYSLARSVLSAEYFHNLTEELLKPTKIYVSCISKLMSSVYIRAIVHITGGGLVDNPPRVIPSNCAFRLHTSKWDVPPIMKFISSIGEVPDHEMHRVFNMGLGMLVVVHSEYANLAVQLLSDDKARIVGEIITKEKDSVEFEL